MRAKTERLKSSLEEQISIPHPIDRQLYLIFWIIVGAAILAFGIYTAIKCADAYKNPGAQMSVNTQQPPFPIFAVCFDNPINTPTFYAEYELNGQVGTVQLTTEQYNWTTDYCDDYFCSCFQFNTHNDIQFTKGLVGVFGTANYPITASRSVAYLLVRPQASGKFTPDTSDTDFDDLNLPTGMFVDATWTVSQRVSTTNWAPLTTKTSTQYAMIQQLETLTSATTKSLLQNLAITEDYLVCQNQPLDSNAPCSGYNGRSGTCNIYCEWSCGPGTNQTIPVSWVCDGYDDCDNYADESNCTIFNCTDGSTILETYRCNGLADCGDGSDELKCPYLPIIVAGEVTPYTTDVTVISDSVTFGWDVALAAFKSVAEISIAVVAFFFPAYFLPDPEMRRFRFLRQAQPKSAETPGSPTKELATPEEPVRSLEEKNEKDGIEIEPLKSTSD